MLYGKKYVKLARQWARKRNREKNAAASNNRAIALEWAADRSAVQNYEQACPRIKLFFHNDFKRTMQWRVWNHRRCAVPSVCSFLTPLLFHAKIYAETVFLFLKNNSCLYSRHRGMYFCTNNLSVLSVFNCLI